MRVDCLMLWRRVGADGEDRGSWSRGEESMSYSANTHEERNSDLDLVGGSIVGCRGKAQIRSRIQYISYNLIQDNTIVHTLYSSTRKERESTQSVPRMHHGI